MRTTVLRALREEARAWWAHRELRRWGEAAEAACRERASIRLHLEVMRRALATKGAHVSTGRGGTIVHYARGSTLSSCRPVRHMAAARMLVRLGLPFVDTGPAPDPWALARLPLVAVGEEADDPPWGSLSRVSFEVYAARAQALGAVVVLGSRSRPGG